MNKIFSERVCSLMKEKRITTYDLSDKLQIKQPSAYNLSRGIYKPTYDNLIKIADVLGVYIDYLVGRTDNSEVNE